NERCEQHDGERREDAPDAPLIEGDEREAVKLSFAPDDAGDQEAGDDEENIDADIAAVETGNASVEKDDRHDRKGAESVDILSMMQVGRSLFGLIRRARHSEDPQRGASDIALLPVLQCGPQWPPFLIPPSRH